MLQPDDPVALFHSAEAMGDEDAGHVARQMLNGMADGVFVGLIQGGGGLVKDDHIRLRIERPCNADALRLAPGKSGAIFANGLAQALRPVIHKINGRLSAGRAHGGFIPRLAPMAESDIFGKCAGKQKRHLGNIADTHGEGGRPFGGQRNSVNSDTAAGRRQKAAQDARECALA